VRLANLHKGQKVWVIAAAANVDDDRVCFWPAAARVLDWLEQPDGEGGTDWEVRLRVSSIRATPLGAELKPAANRLFIVSLSHVYGHRRSALLVAARANLNKARALEDLAHAQANEALGLNAKGKPTAAEGGGL